jgi:hypothetical protein
VVDQERDETMTRKRTGVNRGTQAAILRRELAKKNLIEREKRSPIEQLALLNKRLGDGVGAARERARLAAEIAAGNKPKKQNKQHANATS